MIKKVLIRTFISVVSLLVLLWILSPLAVRTIANTTLEPYQLALSDQTSIRINPFAFVIEAHDFQLLHKEQGLVQFQSLYVNLDPIRLVTGQLQVEALRLNGVKTQVKQTEHGLLLNNVDIVALFATAESEAETKAKSESLPNEPSQTENSEPFINKVQINNIALSDFTLGIEQTQQNIALQLALHDLIINQAILSDKYIEFDLKLALDFAAEIAQQAQTASAKATTKFETEVTLKVEDIATIEVANASLIISKLAAHASGYDISNDRLGLSVSDLALLAKSSGPQINGLASLELSQLNVTPKQAESSEVKTLALTAFSIPEIKLEQIQNQASPEINVAEVLIEDLSLMRSDDESLPQLLSLDELRVVDLVASMTGVEIDQINLGKIDVHALLTQTKELRPLFLAASPEVKETSQAQNENEETDSVDGKEPKSDVANEAQATNKFAIRLNTFQLVENLDVYFADNSVEPSFSSHFYLQHASLNDLNSATPEQVAKLKIVGGIDEYTKLNVGGDLQPFLPAPVYSVKGKLTELSLPELSPYVDQALGYVIETGQLDNQFDFKIEGDIIEGEANTLLKAIDLTAIEQSGEKNGLSGGAVSLNMALNMLKDGDGNVELAIPISGDLNNPSIGLSGIVGLVVKQATMSAAKDYLITTFLPYSKVVKIALSASDSLLKMSFEPMQVSPLSSSFNEEQIEYLTQLSGVLTQNSDINIKLCPVAGQDGAADMDKAAQLASAKRQGAAVKEYLVQTLNVPSNKLFACAAEVDEEGNTRIEFEQL